MSDKQLKIDFGGHSTAGIKAQNQDAFGAYPAKPHEAKYKGICAAIADGVSSSDRGGEASQVAVTNFISDYYSTPETWTVKESAARVLNSLNSWLFQNGFNGNSRYNQLVTTFSSVIFKSTSAHLFHVGDSAIFRLRGATLEPLSRAHTLTQRGDQSVLTRALGMDSLLEADYQQLAIEAGDLFLLTTDGVHDSLSIKDLQKLLCEPYKSLEQLSQRIISHALSNGSEDNLSCLLCRVDQLPHEDIDEAHRNILNRAIPPVMSRGNRIDHYIVDRVLYSGTRSHLYVVHEQGQDTKYVLKAPSENFNDDAPFLESFIRERWIGQQLDHPNIMQVIKTEHDSNFMYNVYAYIPAQDLRQWMIDNPHPSIARVRNIIAQIASALRAFQRKSMVHRDLKPENILIDTNDWITLVDFGTVQVNGLTEITTAIEEHAPVGSVNYIAPEYLMGQTGLYRSDIFSLGVIGYEMLCGELPFKTQSGRHIPSNYSPWGYTDIREHRADIPIWINGAIKRACAPNPKDRYAALSEFNQDLLVPNNQFSANGGFQPLLERNPTRFWQCVSVLLLAMLAVSHWLR